MPIGPQGKVKGQKSKGNKTDICLNFNFGRCTSPCPAGRPHTCSHCGRNGRPSLGCFQCPEQENSGSSNAPTQQKEERQGKEGRKAKADQLIRLLLLIPPVGNPSSSPADLTCVPRRNRRIILKPASLSPLLFPFPNPSLPLPSHPDNQHCSTFSVDLQTASTVSAPFCSASSGDATTSTSATSSRATPHDLSSDSLWEEIFSKLRNHLVDFVYLGTPCKKKRSKREAPRAPSLALH